MWYLLTKHCKTSSMTNWVCSSWGELRSHYPVFLGVWLSFHAKKFGRFHNFLVTFIVSIISWKYEACRWWIEIYSEMDPICLAELTEWISVFLQMGWKYPSGALCLYYQFIFDGKCTRQEFKNEKVKYGKVPGTLLKEVIS